MVNSDLPLSKIMANSELLSTEDNHNLENNILLELTMPLLSLLVSIRQGENSKNILELRQKIIDQIRYFEYRAKIAKYSNRTILAVRYSLCTALDEAVLKSPFGKNSIWLQQSLLVTLHNESNGGDNFYVIIENLLKNPENNLHLNEVFYYITSLGFEGKYYNNDKSLRATRQNLFRALQAHKEEEKENFSTGLMQPIHRKDKFIVLLWGILIGTFLILTGTFSILNIYSKTENNNTLNLLEAQTYIRSNNELENLNQPNLQEK